MKLEVKASKGAIDAELGQRVKFFFEGFEHAFDAVVLVVKDSVVEGKGNVEIGAMHSSNAGALARGDVGDDWSYCEECPDGEDHATAAEALPVWAHGGGHGAPAGLVGPAQPTGGLAGGQAAAFAADGGAARPQRRDEGLGREALRPGE